MKKYLFLACAIAAATFTPAAAGPRSSSSSSFYGANGSFAGSAITRGSS
jgi:hypothetical protein